MIYFHEAIKQLGLVEESVDRAIDRILFMLDPRPRSIRAIQTDDGRNGARFSIVVEAAVLAVITVSLHPSSTVDALLLLDQIFLAPGQSEDRSQPRDVTHVGRSRRHEQILLRLHLRHDWRLLYDFVRIVFQCRSTQLGMGRDVRVYLNMLPNLV